MTSTTNRNTTRNIRRLPAGTLVVNTDDAEPGRIVGVLGVNHRDEASTYYVKTQYGTEVWKAKDLFVPDQN